VVGAAAVEPTQLVIRSVEEHMSELVCEDGCSLFRAEPGTNLDPMFGEIREATGQPVLCFRDIDFETVAARHSFKRTPKFGGADHGVDTAARYNSGVPSVWETSKTA
jgi:hypothetical protein